MRLCQDLGYHSLPAASTDPKVQNQAMMFWIVFAMDRGLSLNFGRCHTIQDYDISSARPSLADPTIQSSDYGVFLCVTSAELACPQGDVYQQLFSARAQFESHEILTQRVPVLAERALWLRRQLASVRSLCCMLPFEGHFRGVVTD
jgi:hypothetical protein